MLKSKDRVRTLGEVFTPERIVNAMLDLVATQASDVTARFLEPSCGNGNFLVAILGRKLATIARQTPQHNPEQRTQYERLALQALTSIYGVDICPENVAEAKQRMTELLRQHYTKHLKRKATGAFGNAVKYVLDLNIQQGDMLDGTDSINFTEFEWQGDKVVRRVFALSTLLTHKSNSLLSQLPPEPLRTHPPVPYLALGNPALPKAVSQLPQSVAVLRP